MTYPLLDLTPLPRREWFDYVTNQDFTNKATGAGLAFENDFSPNLKATYGATGDGVADDSAEITAAVASGARVYVPEGVFSRPGTFFDVLGNFHGDGQLEIGGVTQARDRSFLTVEIADASDDRQLLFDGDWSKSHRLDYMFVGSNVGSTPINSYRTLTRAAMSVEVYDFTGGTQTDPADHTLGRTGAMARLLRVYHGGQGDLVGEQFHGEVYSARVGATHFLASPAVVKENGGLTASSAGTGAYLNHSEYIYGDNGLAVAVIDRVRNYQRTNAGNSIGQVWIHDRPQSTGALPIDAAYNPTGIYRRLFDATAADLDADKAAFLMRTGDRIYGNATSVGDSIGARFAAATTGDDYLVFEGGGWKIVVDGVAELLKPTAWANLALVNSWVAEGVDYAAPSYRRAASRVVLRGIAKAGANFTVLGTLPAGFRPAQRQTFLTATPYGVTQISVWVGGEIVVNSVQSDGVSNFVGLDGVTFDPA